MEIQTLVFFGNVGSGKGTQAQLLLDLFKNKYQQESVYTSTGNEYRKLIEANSYTSSLVKESITSGKLQPDFLTNTLFTNILINSLSEDKNLIADGFPRTIKQAEAFEMMMKFYNRQNVKVVYIEVSKEEAMKRNLLRARHDDTEEGIKKRFEEYENNVLPALNYFRNKPGYTIYTINGEQTVEMVHQEIINKLGYKD